MINALMLKRAAALGALIVAGTFVTPRPAAADTASTIAIAAGAAAIVGALLYDSSNHPYYVRNNRRYYVTQQEAQYYRSHHRGYERRAYVPEREYPVQRDPYHNNRDYHQDHR
jgi:hypothetical protein